MYNKRMQYVIKSVPTDDKQALEKKCEPIGYKTVDDLIAKYGKEKMIDRQGCSLHHPFD